MTDHAILSTLLAADGGTVGAICLTPNPVNVTLTAEMEGRTIAGIVLPWGSYGRTNRGKLRAAAGSVRLPADLSRVKLFGVGHDRETPVGYAISAEDSAEGLRLTFKVAPTAAGDLALLEATSKVRDGFSVELDDLRVSGDRITQADLSGVGLVTVPAFADARVDSIAASAPPPEPAPGRTPGQDEDDEDDSGGDGGQAPVRRTPGQDEDDEDDSGGDGGQAPVHASAPRSLPGARRRTRRNLSTLYAAMAAQATDQRLTPELTAALADITHTANPWVQPGQYEAELWSGLAYQRQIVPLMTGRPLTSYKIRGWRWKVKPVVADYLGDKTAVPSNPAVTEEATTEAKRLAGAHDIDRKYRDFGDAEFFASYYAAMTESYAVLSDQRAAEFLVGSATPTGDPATDLISAVTTASLRIQSTTGAPATFALVSGEDWLQLMQTKAQDLPGFLSLLPIPPSGFKPSIHVPAGTTIVGVKPAVSWYEREGSPIRVETVDITKGGIDGGVFGYYGTLLNDARGLVSAAVTPIVPPVADGQSSSREGGSRAGRG